MVVKQKNAKYLEPNSGLSNHVDIPWFLTTMWVAPPTPPPACCMPSMVLLGPSLLQAAQPSPGPHHSTGSPAPPFQLCRQTSSAAQTTSPSPLAAHVALTPALYKPHAPPICNEGSLVSVLCHAHSSDIPVLSQLPGQEQHVGEWEPTNHMLALQQPHVAHGLIQWSLWGCCGSSCPVSVDVLLPGVLLKMRGLLLKLVKLVKAFHTLFFFCTFNWFMSCLVSKTLSKLCNSYILRTAARTTLKET